MISEIDINKHNFSKIGKYISNKLHHIHSPVSNKHSANNLNNKNDQKINQKQHTHDSPKSKTKKEAKKEKWDYSPAVGTYRVHYSAIDKNIHPYNFSRSTPHFFGQKYKANEITPCTKEYPEGLQLKQKGFTELGRMVGRNQIKGSIRKNLQNPHEARFQTYRFPTLAFDSKGVCFSKMSPRKDILDTQRVNGAEYDCCFEVNMKRLNSHIIPFQKQTSRPECLFQQSLTYDGGYAQQQIKQAVSKSVEWSKQLSRQVEGVLPSYMQKTVTSRMAISQINLKTLEMNCTDLKDRPKLQRRKIGAKNRVIIYAETNREN